MLNKTKIVCTIGNSSEPEEVMEQMLLAGMDAIRLNFGYGDINSLTKYVVTAKKLALIHGKPLAIMLDTYGPKIKTHSFADGEATIGKGCKVTIHTKEETLGNSDSFSVNYPGLYSVVKTDDIILVNGYRLRILKKNAKTKTLECEALNSFTVNDETFVNLPNILTDIPYVNNKDRARIDLAADLNLDFLVASFVRNKQDILDVKEVLKAKNSNLKVVAKIENAIAVKNFDEILEVADGIMIARGDLSVEVPLEDIPVIQKYIVQKCNEAGKFVVVSTQILSSMTRNKKPSRAEVSDVATAVWDGLDAIMLSDVTAIGKYPVKGVETLAAISSRIEKEIDYRGRLIRSKFNPNKSLNDAVALSVAETALDIDAKLIIAFTESGETARRISKIRPCCPIAAVTSKEDVRLSLQLNWGVHPVVSNQPTNEKDYHAKACEIAAYYGVKEGESVIITGGNGHGNTNFMKVIKL